MKILSSLGVLVGALLIAGSANAAQIAFANGLSSDNEVTPPDVAGANPNGGAVMVYDDATKTLCGRIEWDGLTGVATGVHVHKSPKDQPAADGAANDKVIIPIPANAMNVTFKVVLPADWATALMSGNQSEIYANVHTTKNAKGEIRGSMEPYPDYQDDVDNGNLPAIVCPANALQIGAGPAADAGTDSGTSSSTSSTSSSSTSSSGSTSGNGDNNTSSSSSSSTGGKAPIEPEEEAPPADSGGCSTTASTPTNLLSVGVLAGLALAVAARGRQKKKK